MTQARLYRITCSTIFKNVFHITNQDETQKIPNALDLQQSRFLCVVKIGLLREELASIRPYLRAYSYIIYSL